MARTVVALACVVLFVGTTVYSTAWLLADEPTAPTKSQVDEISANPGHTFRLAFKLVAADNVRSCEVLCTEGNYSLHHAASKDGNEMQFDVDGKIEPVDGGKSLNLWFKALVNQQNEDGSGWDMGGSGSATVRLGTTRTLTSFGQYALQVTATVDKADGE